MANDYNTLSPEYATLWDTMEIVRDASQIERTVAKIIKFKSQYEEVEAATNVPWYVVGIMDMREGGGGCCTHLHNGDGLKKRTVNVPANRPTTGPGPFSWKESAIDALKFKGFHKIDDWCLERIAWVFERYNGFGYRQKDINIPSPYLWGGTNHQSPGKYIRDHVFSKTVLDPQIGCMALLRRIAEAESIEIVSKHGATADASESSPASNRKAEKKPLGKVISEAVKDNKETIGVLVAAGGGAGVHQATKEAPPPKIEPKRALEKAQETRAQVEQATDLGKWVKSAFSGPDALLFGAIIAVALGLVGYEHFRKR